MFGSIRWRLVFSYVLLALLTVGLGGLLALSLIRRTVVQQEVAHLTANAEAIARQARPLLWPVRRTQDLRDLASTSSFLSNARVRILDPSGRALAEAGVSAPGNEFVWVLPSGEWSAPTGSERYGIFIVGMSSDARMPFRLLSEDGPPVLEHLSPDAPLTLVRWDSGAWSGHFEFHVVQEPGQVRELVRSPPVPRSDRVITVPVGGSGGALGHVEMSNAVDSVTEALSTTRRAFALAGTGAILGAAVAGLLVSRGLSAPLRDLASATKQMSDGELSARAPVRGRDEIGQVSRQFNEMAERLQFSFDELAAERDALRRFIADASHELRTPITALKNFNDLLQGAAAHDREARAEFLAESQAQIERLAWIARNLLDLSRFDAGLVALDLAEHDAAQLLSSVVDALRPIAQEKGITLSQRALTSAPRLRCDRARIELALTNLVDNALKFTLAGGEVEVGAENIEGAVRLWVRDTGRGIEPEDREHIFQRFYRGQDTPGEGSGLGLSIVQSIVQAHGGRVTVESSPGAGSLFTVELPQD